MGKRDDAVKTLLTRGVERVYPSREALERLLHDKRKLRLYIGMDPTGPHLHLGHLTNLLTLKQFQKLGHQVIFLVGDFTAQIGDPTDKLAQRQPLTRQQVKENFRTFRQQVGRILPLTGRNPVRFAFNSKWWDRMPFAEGVRLAQQVTVQRMLERDMFQERLRSGKPIGVHEFLYPLMQGYDSVAMDVDGEMGGTDQTFNMLMGRTLMRSLRGKEKFVVTTKLLEHPKTGRKLMNKSEGGMINLDDSPGDMFGKVMALDDQAMFSVAELSSEMPLDRVEELRRGVSQRRLNPVETKKEIAGAVVTTVYGGAAAQKAATHFEALFTKRSVAEDIPELRLNRTTVTAQDLVVLSGAVKSNAEAWRLVGQGGLEVDGKVVREPKRDFTLHGGEVVRIGKKRFFRVKTK